MRTPSRWRTSEEVKFERDALAMRVDVMDAPEPPHQLLKGKRPACPIDREHLPLDDEGP